MCSRYNFSIIADADRGNTLKLDVRIDKILLVILKNGLRVVYFCMHQDIVIIFILCIMIFVYDVYLCIHALASRGFRPFSGPVAPETIVSGANIVDA